MYIEDGFSLNLAAARVNRNLKKDDVANEIGVTTRTISNWEDGRTTPDGKHLVKLSEMYQTPLSMLRLEP